MAIGIIMGVTHLLLLGPLNWWSISSQSWTSFSFVLSTIWKKLWIFLIELKKIYPVLGTICWVKKNRIRPCTKFVLFYLCIFSANKANYKTAVGRALIGTRVITKYNNKTYCVDDIIWDKTPQNTFPDKVSLWSIFYCSLSVLEWI